MRNVVWIGILGIALLAGWTLKGAGAAGSPSSKVGYIDLNRTLNETKIGRRAKKRLEGEKAKLQKEIDKAQEELKAKADDLAKKESIYKPDELRQKQTEIQNEYVALQNKFLKYQQDLARKEAELTRDILKEASKIIEEIARRDGYTIMLEKNESAVLWADPATDITDEVNRRLDKK